MPRLRKRKWNRLASGLLVGGGLYVPPFIGRLLPKIPKAEFAGYPCCCPEADPCDQCQADTTPAEIQVVLAGIGDALCGSCGTFNGTFVLTQNVGEACEYNYEFPENPVCGFTARLRLEINQPGAVGVKNALTLNAVLQIQWKFDPDGSEAPYDCQFSNFDLPYDSENVINDQCNGSPGGTDSTCVITAL